MVPFWLCLSAVGAGVLNAIAGGGTLLTFPALIFALTSSEGWEPALATVAANMTSTVALMPGSAASAWGFRRELAQSRQWVWLLTAPSLVGGTVGALLLIRLDERVFRSVVPWLVLTATV